MTHTPSSLFEMRPGSKMALLIAFTGIGLIVGGFLAFSLAAAWLHVGLRDIQSYLLQPQYAILMQLANALASIIAFGLPSVGIALLSKGKFVENLGSFQRTSSLGGFVGYNRFNIKWGIRGFNPKNSGFTHH